MNILSNIKDNKLTTGTGVALLLLVLSNALGYNVGEKIGMDNSTVVVSVGAVISAVINIFARDPKQSTKSATK